jgi:hypothetical protein
MLIWVTHREEMRRVRHIASRWRGRYAIERRERAIARAIDAVRTPTVEAELRAIASTQFNR